MKGGENTLNLSALQAAALRARTVGRQPMPRPPSYAKGSPRPNAPNYSLGNSTTRFLKERTEDLYERARQAIVVKDLLLILATEQRCKGSIVLKLPDVEGLKQPVLEAIQAKYRQSGGGLFGPSKKDAVQKVLDSVLNGTPVECAMIPLALQKLQNDYQVMLPGERELPGFVNGFDVSLRDLEFLQSGHPAYSHYKNVPSNIVMTMLSAQKGEDNTLEGYVEALKLLPELGLNLDQLLDQFEREATPRDNLYTYTKFLKAIKDVQARGTPIQKEFVLSIGKQVRRDTLPDILARILSYLEKRRVTPKNTMKYLTEAKEDLIYKINQSEGISADPILLGSAFSLL